MNVFRASDSSSFTSLAAFYHECFADRPRRSRRRRHGRLSLYLKRTLGEAGPADPRACCACTVAVPSPFPGRRTTAVLSSLSLAGRRSPSGLLRPPPRLDRSAILRRAVPAPPQVGCAAESLRSHGYAGGIYRNRWPLTDEPVRSIQSIGSTSTRCERIMASTARCHRLPARMNVFGRDYSRDRRPIHDCIAADAAAES